MTKEEIKEIEKKLIETTNEFCTQKLDDEYRQLCEKLIKKLGRKRDVPFQRGKLEIWAAAVIHTIGSINFLYAFADINGLGSGKTNLSSKPLSSISCNSLYASSYFIILFF